MNFSTVPTRRDFLRSAGLAALAATLYQRPSATQPATPATPALRPNILFILADDLGYGDLGCFGQQKILTPNLDRLAIQGTRFTHCYAGSVVCAPSRSTLMTGQHTGHTRVRGNHGQNAPKHDGQEGRIPLTPEDITVATVLKRVGYATGITGKWGLGEPGSTGLPNDHGFDQWLGYLNQDHAPDYYTDYLWHNREKQSIPENDGGKQVVYSCDRFADFADDFIRTHKDGPFFLYAAYTTPHSDLQVPGLGVYADKDWTEKEKILAAMITRLDTYVGRHLALLDELGIAENTLIFFASDNGASNQSLEFFQRSGPLREKKGSLYEGGIRTPMLVRWPGHIAPGTVSEVTWYFPDFLPTAAALAGATPPPNIDGLSILPTLLGQPQPELDTRYLYWEDPKKNDLGQALRQGPWKTLRHKREQPLELYNLTQDPAETVNLAGEHPELIATLTQHLTTARTQSPHWPAGDTQSPPGGPLSPPGGPLSSAAG